MEDWRVIPGYPERYRVSNLGRVKTLAHTVRQRKRDGGEMTVERPERILALQCSGATEGYCLVNMQVEGRHHMGKVHRLVALAFIENPHAKLEVNHKNGIKKDNTPANLEWTTKAENTQHSYDNLHRKKHAKTTPVVGTRDGESVVFSSTLEAAKAVGRSPGSIHQAIHTGGLSAGFYWAKI